MNVVSAVANLQKELDYYKDVCKEQKEIIKQLTEGPGEIEYIHPFDMGEILNSPENQIVDLWKVSGPGNSIVEIEGKKYRQSAFMPAKTKKVR